MTCKKTTDPLKITKACVQKGLKPITYRFVALRPQGFLRIFKGSGKTNPEKQIRYPSARFRELVDLNLDSVYIIGYEIFEAADFVRNRGRFVFSRRDIHVD